MKKEKITQDNVKVGYYHEAGTGVAPIREAVEKGTYKVYGGELEEIEKILSKYPEVDIKIVK